MNAIFAFLEFATIVAVGAIALFVTLGWMEQQHPRWRRFAAFGVASGAAFAASFALDLFVGAYVGFYSFSPLALPVFTWSGIAIALHCLARSPVVSPRWIQIPYLGFGGIAV